MSDTTINLTPELYDYLQKTSLREADILKKLREETKKTNMQQMQISPEQGQFMQLLIEMLGAEKTLDIGSFTGYSALSVALALPETGKVFACDVNEEWAKIAQHYWKLANVTHKIHLKLAPALDTLDELIHSGQKESFDFAFIDADKQNYINYYEKSLILLRRGGVIAIDNVLWEGKVADTHITDSSTTSIRNLNTKLHHDERVTISMLPIGDGLTLARKR